MKYLRQMPEPSEVKEKYPVTKEIKRLKDERDIVLKNIFSGKDSRMFLCIGPCSADNADAVIDYISRLRKVSDEVSDKVFIVPRIYTNKPRTVGIGYKGMLHQPDPEKASDMLKGILSIRELHKRAAEQTEFTCADEMLYPENHEYLSDLLAYVAVGARSVEDQQHRMTASGIGIPVGMKNPTSGDLSVTINSVIAAQSKHTFLYRGWETETDGNPYAHVILRGFVDKFGRDIPNYHYEDLKEMYNLYQEHKLSYPSIVVDCNHSNSGKRFEHQIRIAKDVLHSRNESSELKSIIKGLMIESYIEDGRQDEHTHIYGKSITDPCLGWEKTERLIKELAEIW